MVKRLNILKLLIGDNMKHPLNLVSELIGDNPNTEKLMTLVNWLSWEFEDKIKDVTTNKTGATIHTTNGKTYKWFGDKENRNMNVLLKNAILKWFTFEKPIIGMEGYTIDGQTGTIIDMGTVNDYEHLKQFDRVGSLSGIIKHCEQGFMSNCFLVAMRINGKTSVWWFTSGGVQLTENKPRLPV